MGGLEHSFGERYRRAIERIDAANAEDPRKVDCAGELIPAELLYGRRMSAVLERFRPDAGELLRLAVRAQHIRRWTSPRSSYPDGKAGYHRWRNALKRLHGEMAGAILRSGGYSTEEADRVRSLIGKENMRQDEEAQTLEDVACLVFLDHHLAEFAARNERKKTIDILRKTWAKMSSDARQSAIANCVSDGVRELMEAALQQPAGGGDGAQT